VLQLMHYCCCPHQCAHHLLFFNDAPLEGAPPPHKVQYVTQAYIED
jgi:hypothetical protein